MSARKQSLNNSRGTEHQRGKRKQRTPFKKVLIVCEGKETEIKYFLKFKGELRNENIKVIPVHLDHTDAFGVVDDAIKLVEKYQKEGDPIDIKENIKEGDSVWCVFDSDKNSKEQLNKAFETAKKIHLKLYSQTLVLKYGI